MFKLSPIKQGEYTSGASASAGISNTQTSESGTSSVSAIMESLQNTDFFSQLLGLTSQQQQGTESSVTTNLSPEMLSQLTELAAGTERDISIARDNKASAIQTGIDLSDDAMTTAIAQVIEAGIGNVAELGGNAGAYGSTVQGKAGAQLGAEAAKTGAQVQLDTILSQQGMANQDLQALLASLGQTLSSGQGAVSTTTNTFSNTGSESTEQSTTGNETVDIDSSSQTDEEYDKESDSTTVSASVSGGFGG